MAFASAPLRAVLTNVAGYALSLGAGTGPTSGGPITVVLTDRTGHVLTMSQSAGFFVNSPVPIVLCDASGHELTTGLTPGAFIGTPLAAVLTDKDGNASSLGLPSGTFFGAPISIVLTDPSGNPIVGVNPVSAMPTGALGIWFVDQAATSPRRAVPNSLSGAAVSSNLVTATRRQFSNTVYYTVTTGITVTDLFAAGPDGKTFAARVVGDNTHNWVLGFQPSVFAAGTYTLAFDYKSNTGLSQNFRYNLGAGVTTGTATTSWQTLAVTVVLTSGSKTFNLLNSPDGVTAGDLLIDNFRIYPGSSDLGAQDFTPLHMYLGVDNNDTKPAISGGAMDMSTGGSGLVQFPSAQTLTAFTAICLASKTARRDSFDAFLSSVSATNWQQFAAFHDAFTNGTTFYSGGTSLIPQASAYFAPVMLDTPDTKYQVTVNRYDGTTADYFHNDVKVISSSANPGKTAAIQDLWAGLLAGINFPSFHKVSAIALYPRALTDTEVRQAVQYLEARATANGLGVDFTRFVLAEGDSITNGGSGPAITAPYPNLFIPNANPLAHGFKAAVGGAVLNGAAGSNSLYGRQAADNAMIPPNKNGRTFIYTVLIGHNDGTGTYSGNPTQYAADVGTFLLAQKAAGWDKIVLITLPPSSAVGFNAWRNTVNGIWTGTGWAAAHGVDAIADFAADPTIGPDAAGSNTTYYGDGTHPTDACIAIMEPIYRAAVNGL